MGLELLRLLPSFFAVPIVGTLTVLLSLSSLELTYRNDFQLEWRWARWCCGWGWTCCGSGCGTCAGNWAGSTWPRWSASWSA